MIGDHTYPWAWRQTTGTLRFKNILQHTAGYTETRKMVSAAAAASVMAATNTVVAGATFTPANATITNPDVPRNLTITTGATTADIAAGDVRITGTNVEGKVITELFTMSDNLNGSVTGNKAFKTVTSIVFPAADGATATISVGVGSKIGVNHRLLPSKTTIVVLSDTAADGSLPLIQADPSASSLDSNFVELNTVTPATAPNGTTFLTIVYFYHKIAVRSLNDSPDYFTSTSTSASTTSISTSSTSLSTTISTFSTSSTSASTSSTSTSTTTVA